MSLWVLNGTSLPDVGTTSPRREVIFPSHPRISGQVARPQTTSPAPAPRQPRPPVDTGPYRGSPQISPPPHPAPPPPFPCPPPARALTLRLGIFLRFGQKQPAQRGQEQQGPHRQGPGPSVRPAVRAGWKLRDEAGGAAATHGARPGGGAAPAPSAPGRPPGGGFPADAPELQPRGWSGSLWPVCAAPGSCRRPALLPPISRGCCTPRERGESGRGSDFHTPEPAPRPDGIHTAGLAWAPPGGITGASAVGSRTG